MKNTVTRALSDRPVKDEQAAVDFLNKELVPVVKEMRDVLNVRSSTDVDMVTNGTGAYTTIWTSDVMPSGAAWHIHATALGRGSTDSAVYAREAFFVNNGSGPSQVGATLAVSTFETAAGADIRFVISSNQVQLQVQDDGTQPYLWIASVSILSRAAPG